MIERRMEGDDARLDGDFIVDEKSRQVELTDPGHEKVEGLLVSRGMLEEEGKLIFGYQPDAPAISFSAALRANYLFHKEVEYIVSRINQIVLIDEHTGRTMPGRRR